MLYGVILVGATLTIPQLLLCEPLISFTHAEIQSTSSVVEEKLRNAVKQGFFYVEIPPETKSLIPHAVNFANTFYKDQQLKEARLSLTSGYHDFPHAQFESFFCEQPHWNIYPEAIQACAHSLTELSLTILRKVMPLVLPQLSPRAWTSATGGLLEGKGTYFFSFNHYRPEKKVIGLLPHQDTGYITLLYTSKKGLYGLIDTTWRSIPPKPGFLIVNLGKAFEMLVNDHSKLVASWHFVEQISLEKHSGDRISFGLFSDNNPNAPVMAATPEGHLMMKYETYAQYLKEYMHDVETKIIDVPPTQDLETD